MNLLLDYVTNLLRQVDPLITIDEVKWVHTLYASRSFGVKTKPKSMQQHEQPELNQNVFEKGQVEDTTNLYYDEDDEGTVPCLVPYGDSMNHHADVHVSAIRGIFEWKTILFIQLDLGTFLGGKKLGQFVL